MKIKIILSAVIMAAIQASYIAPSFACECRVSEPIDVEMAKATAIFAGRVTSVDSGYEDESNNFQGAEGYIFLDVIQSWKGASTPNVKIKFREKGRYGGCDLYTKPGEEYLVYAYGDKVLTTNKCATKPLADSSKKIEELNKAVPPK
jgi:hypothetical protein